MVPSPLKGQAAFDKSSPVCGKMGESSKDLVEFSVTLHLVRLKKKPLSP